MILISMISFWVLIAISLRLVFPSKNFWGNLIFWFEFNKLLSIFGSFEVIMGAWLRQRSAMLTDFAFSHSLLDVLIVSSKSIKIICLDKQRLGFSWYLISFTWCKSKRISVMILRMVFKTSSLVISCRSNQKQNS